MVIVCEFPPTEPSLGDSVLVSSADRQNLLSAHLQPRLESFSRISSLLWGHGSGYMVSRVAHLPVRGREGLQLRGHVWQLSPSPAFCLSNQAPQLYMQNKSSRLQGRPVRAAALRVCSLVHGSSTQELVRNAKVNPTPDRLTDSVQGGWGPTLFHGTRPPGEMGARESLGATGTEETGIHRLCPRPLERL